MTAMIPKKELKDAIAKVRVEQGLTSFILRTSFPNWSDSEVVKWLNDFDNAIVAAVQESNEVRAERTMSMPCPSCHRLIEVVVLASLRQ
jgi:hypothetical protein